MGEVELMLAWLAGYENATTKAIDDLRVQIANASGVASLPTGAVGAPA